MFKNNKFKKIRNIILISSVFVFSNISFSHSTYKSISFQNISYGKSINVETNNACIKQGVGINSALEVEAAIFNSLSNMFPIEIGKGSGICACNMGPIERFGITLSYWSYVGAIEVTSIENCSPTLGMDISFIQDGFKDIINSTNNALVESFSNLDEISNIFKELGLKNIDKPASNNFKNIGASSSNGNLEERHSYQVHFIPPSIIINEIMREILATCFVPKKDNIISFSEFSPIYQNDFLSAIFNPETILTANPIATQSCMAESASLQGKINIDSLFWCAGSWGHLFPISQNVGSGDRLSAQGLITSRKLYSMFKKGQLLNTSGPHMTQGACLPTYSPILPKSQINLVPLYPSSGKRKFPIGYSSKNFSLSSQKFKSKSFQIYGVYQKTNCCFL